MKNINRDKLIVYGSNFGAHLVNSALKFPFGVQIGSPTALLYGLLDCTCHFSDAVRNSKYTTLAKSVGAVLYGLSALYDISSVGYNPAMALNLVLDGAMTWQLCRDTGINGFKSSLNTVQEGISNLEKRANDNF